MQNAARPDMKSGKKLNQTVETERIWEHFQEYILPFVSYKYTQFEDHQDADFWHT